MRIAAHVSDQVETQIKLRGAKYYQQGKVTIFQGSSTRVFSNVSGSLIYEVHLSTDVEDELDYSCTCPYYRQYYEPCKHVWATLLASDQAGHLDALRHSPFIELIAYDDSDYLEEDPGDDEDFSQSLPDRIVRIVQPENGPRETVHGWSDHFRELLHQEETTGHFQAEPHKKSAESELIYVVNRTETLEEKRLVLEVYSRTMKQNGEWGKPRRFNASPTTLQEVSDQTDRQIIELLLGADDLHDWRFPYYGYAQKHRAFALSLGMYEILIPLLGKTGRFYMEHRDARVQDSDLSPISLDEGPPWKFQVACRHSADKKKWELVGRLNRGEETIDLDEPSLLLTGGWIFGSSGAARLDHGRSFSWISFLRAKKSLQVPVQDADSMLDLFYKSLAPPPIEWPDSLKPVEVRQPPHPLVKVGTFGRDTRRYPRLQVELEFRYGEEVIRSTEPRDRIFMRKGRKLLLRDREAEAAAWTQLGKLGCRPPPAFRQKSAGPDEQFLELVPRHLPRLINAMLQKGWTVEAEGTLHRQAGKFSMSVRSGIDWFDLEGYVDFDGAAVALPKLLKAIKRRKNTVLLDDGTHGVLPEDWLKRYGFLLSAGTVHEDRIRFQPSQVLLLDALLAAEGETHWDKTFDKARDALRRFEGIKPLQAPAGFRGTLRPYQKEGLGWFAFLRKFEFGGCLADDMGLGKTVQVLALLESRRLARAGENWRNRAGIKTTSKKAPSLVVMPRSLIFNWISETERFTPKLRVLDHTGPARRKERDHLLDYDLVFTTYGTLRTDVMLLKDVPFDYVVLDESQAIKNRASQTAKAARLLKGRHRLALSGTPIENHIDELFSLFEFLNPGMLGASKAFNGNGESGAEAQQMLARAVRPFILRRTKEAVATDLPAKLEQTLYCDLRADERKRYDEVRNYYRASLAGKMETVGLKRAKIQVLEALLRLRQAACHPGLLDRELRHKPGTKVDLLLDRLHELQGEGHKALVFSQFTSFLAIVRGRLDEDGVTYEYLDGRTRKRGEKVERFQNDPECRLFLISLKAGGLGLNLTAADYVFLLDPWWNPAVESQAIDRAHRIGQERRVFAYRLIARDTVEEKVVALQRKKRRLADAIISADGNVIRDLTREDLEFILS